MKILTALMLLGICVPNATGQQFSVSAYEQFLQAHQGMNSSQLLSLYPAGLFKRQAVTNYAAAAYFDSIDARYYLTADEKSLIQNNGFMVTERFDDSTFGYSFGDAYADIYHKDLPVFISTDAILHSIHMSYDEILMNTETGTLISSVDTLLARLRSGIPGLAASYSSYPQMKTMFGDLDVYLTVPMKLLDSTVAPLYAGDDGTVDTLLSLIAAEQPAGYELFASTPRAIDFSQFTPRGHYTLLPALTRYFKAMIWLGRIGFDLSKPVSADIPPTDGDIQRQTIDAVLLSELADTMNVMPLYDQIDGILRFFVGSQDNVTLPQIDTLAQDVNLSEASALLDTLDWRTFQDTLLTEPYASQKILSQILMANPMSPEQVQPPSAFMLFGQRFVIDSYILGNVVYNRIPAKRMLPSPLDVLFAEGNDAAAQLLQSQLNQYQYSSNLAALRYLIDSYGSDFWQMTMYNSWSNAIRSLNPPASRDSLPAFMQTAAWWQEKMNTQLASWAELRHDNLLYAKQSYTAGIPTCSYPASYVEPMPQFFDAVEAYAEEGETEFQQPLLQNSGIASYFANLKAIADTLGNIAGEELSGTPLKESEATFLKNMLTTNHSGECGAPPFNGWFPTLFYGGNSSFLTNGAFDQNLIVADVHTAPTDSLGNPVGWVYHVGTGPVNMAVVIANIPGSGATAFVGPVMSFYEHLSNGYQRLTDQEWQTMYDVPPSLRPSWVNLYLADSTGSLLTPGESLLTGIQQEPGQQSLPTEFMLDQNYPNPFNPTTVISYQLPAVSYVTLKVYDVLGSVVATLVDGQQNAGEYKVQFNGARLASGVYFYQIKAGEYSAVKKMLLLK